MTLHHGLTRERRLVVLVRVDLQSFRPPAEFECLRGVARGRVARRGDTECGPREALASHPSGQKVLSRLVGESGADEQLSHVC